MKVILDLDNTMFHNTVVRDACKEFGVRKLNRKHDLSDLPKEVSDACWGRFEDEKIMCDLQPFEGAHGIDIFLKDRAHTVHVVTARDCRIGTGTTNMVKKHFPYVDDVHIVGSWDKTLVYEQLEADVVIDDHYDHVIQALDSGVPHVYMVSNEHTTYNHDFVEDAKSRGATVIYSLCEFKALYDETFCRK